MRSLMKYPDTSSLCPLSIQCVGSKGQGEVAVVFAFLALFAVDTVCRQQGTELSVQSTVKAAARSTFRRLVIIVPLVVGIAVQSAAATTEASSTMAAAGRDHSITLSSESSTSSRRQGPAQSAGRRRGSTLYRNDCMRAGEGVSRPSG